MKQLNLTENSLVEVSETFVRTGPSVLKLDNGILLIIL